MLGNFFKIILLDSQCESELGRRGDEESQKRVREYGPLLSLLKTTALIAIELVSTRQSLSLTKVSQTMSDGHVLVNVYTQIQEGFVLACHCLTTQTLGFVSENTFEDLMNKGSPQSVGEMRNVTTRRKYKRWRKRKRG
jgi:hypothetical protein